MNAPRHAVQPNRAATRRALWMLVTAAAVLMVTCERAAALPRVIPYVSVSVSPENLDLGTVLEPGVFDSPAELTVHVAANTAHGGVVISATPLQRSSGGQIPLDRFFVKIPGAWQFVPMTAPVVITGPMGPGIFDVVLKFRVETILQNPAGIYTGTITLTCSPGP